MNVTVTLNADCTAAPDQATVNRLNGDVLVFQTGAGQFMVEFASGSPYNQTRFNVATGSVANCGTANATATGPYKYNVTNVATGQVNDPTVIIKP
jgi:hypothetical protein